MKNDVVLFIAAITVFAVSCSDMEKSNFENEPLAVKKETKVVKSKNKKQKIKIETTEKTKDEPKMRQFLQTRKKKYKKQKYP